LADYVVGEIADIAAIRSYLMSDPDYSAYALGDLEPPYSAHACWTAARQRGHIQGLALLYTGLEPAILFLMGDNQPVERILARSATADEVFFTVKPSHRPVLERYFKPVYLNDMYRMRVRRDDFNELAVEGQQTSTIVPLDSSHSGQIQELIRAASEADSREPSDVAFSPDMLDSGTYAGVFDTTGRLIAVGGTHLVARQSLVAAVGNVVTHPDHRRKGLGTFVCHHVTKALLEDGFERVVLNVRRTNEVAIHIYQKLGYTITNEFIEGLAARINQGKIVAH
jgi:ribosomal protein S18 acetylase RimI-like enzyme